MARDERATLLEVHEALSEEQFQKLKYLLESKVPAGLMLQASRMDLCRILLQRFPGQSLCVIAGILLRIGRQDLIQRFQLPLEEQIPEETPREPNGNTPNVTRDPTSGHNPGGIPAPPVKSQRLTEKHLMTVAKRFGNPGEISAPPVKSQCLTEKHLMTVAKRFGNPEGIPAPPMKSQLLTEKHLMTVAQRLGREWQEVGILYLGLERSRLEQIQEENPSNSTLRSFEMLRDWQRRQRHEATASQLLACLERAQNLDPEILNFLRSLQGN